MFAWSLSRPGAIEDEPLDLVEAPDPEPGRGEVRVRVRACGVSRLDADLVAGRLRAPGYPIVPGQTIVGEVDATGKGVERYSGGETVVIGRLRETCGSCQDCLRGDENLCARARFTGFHEDGGFAEHAVARESFAFPIGALDVSSAAALLTEGTRALRGLRHAQAGVWEDVGLYGFDVSASIALQILKHRGCRAHVIAWDEEARARAVGDGATWVGDPEDVPPAPLDRALVLVPDGALVEHALRAVRRGGKVTLAVDLGEPLPGLDPAGCLAGEKVLTTVAENTREDVSELLRVAAEIPVGIEVREYPFAGVHQALADLMIGRSWGAVVVRLSA